MESFFGQLDGFGVGVATEVWAAEAFCGEEGGAGAGEEIGDAVVGVGGGLDDSFEEGEWFLVGVSDAFVAYGAEEGDVPDVGKGGALGVEIESSSLGGLVGATVVVDVQAVGSELAVSDDVEGVSAEAFGVGEDGLMLTAEPSLGDAAGAVGPDDFVHEVIGAEDSVQFDLDVVDGAVIEVDEEGCGLLEEAMEFDESWLEEGEVAGQSLGPGVAVGQAGRSVSSGLGAERRVDVDQVEGLVIEFSGEVEAIAAEQVVGFGGEIDFPRALVGADLYLGSHGITRG